MESWIELQRRAPDIAHFGQARLDGKVAYLATNRSDGTPRVHPVTPILSPTHCFVFADPDSSKVKDLEANPAFCIHCAMSDSSGSSGEFQMHGMVMRVEDPTLRREAEENCTFRPSSRSILYELTMSEVIATSYRGGLPDRRRWRAMDSEAVTS